MNTRELHEANFPQKAYVLARDNDYHFDVLRDEQEKGYSIGGRKVTIRVSHLSGFCKDYSFSPEYNHDAEFKNMFDDMTTDIKKNSIKDLDTFLSAIKKG